MPATIDKDGEVTGSCSHCQDEATSYCEKCDDVLCDDHLLVIEASDPSEPPSLLCPECADGIPPTCPRDREHGPMAPGNPTTREQIDHVEDGGVFWACARPRCGASLLEAPPERAERAR